MYYSSRVTVHFAEEAAYYNHCLITHKMAYLLQLCFDNSRRLSRKSYLFKFKGIQFKLVQNDPRKWADHLLTIVSTNDLATRSRIFALTAEFVSSMAWEIGSAAAVWEVGGSSWPDTLPLSKARGNILSFPRIPNEGRILGCDLVKIPKIKTEEQRRALALFREARASNNLYLAFLFYWQVLEVDGSDAPAFVEKTFRKHRQKLRVMSSDLSNLRLGSQSLSSYMVMPVETQLLMSPPDEGKHHLSLIISTIECGFITAFK